MKKLEIIFIIFAGLSLSMVAAGVVGGSFLTMIALLLMTSFYYAFSFALFTNIRFRQILKKESYQNIKVAEIVLSIAAGIGIANLITGSLYRILNLEGALAMIISGGVICVVVLAFTAWNYRETKGAVNKRIFLRIALAAVILATSYLI